jgi:hypothetical protein
MNLMKRVYIPEDRRILNEKGFELAQAQQRFQNAFSWYTSNAIQSHLDTMINAHNKVGQIIEEIVELHEKTFGQKGVVRDPEPGDGA